MNDLDEYLYLMISDKNKTVKLKSKFYDIAYAKEHVTLLISFIKYLGR